MNSPVFYKKDATTGFKHRVMVMYHGTDPENVGPIAKNGFKVSKKDGLMFGPGIYTSTDLNKTDNYGDATLKVLVYLGEVKKATEVIETTFQHSPVVFFLITLADKCLLYFS